MANTVGTKPTQLAKPVPGADAAEHADDFFSDAPAVSMPAAQSAAAPAAAGGDDHADAFFGDELSATEQPPAAQPSFGGTETSITPQPEFGMWDEAKRTGKIGLDAARRALDYPGGFARAGLASAGGLVTRGKEVVTIDDLKEAAKGNGPGWSEYMARLGVPELGAVDVPLLGKVTGRGTVGFAGDIASDPMTAFGKLTKEVPYIGKMLNAPGNAVDALGEAAYRSALKKVDAKVATKLGLEEASPVADALLEHGAPVGGTKTLAQKVQDISTTMGKLRKGLYDKATERGVTIDFGYPFKRAESFIEELRYKGLEPAAAAMEEMLNHYKSYGKIALDRASAMKTALFQAVPKSAWEAAPELRNVSNKFKVALGQDMKEAIVQGGNKAEKGLGDAVNVVNEKWGPLLDATDPLRKQALKEAGTHLTGSQIDHTILSLGGVSKWAIKKALDMATTTTGRTVIGKTLMSKAASGAANRTFINAAAPDSLQENVSPQGQGQ